MHKLEKIRYILTHIHIYLARFQSHDCPFRRTEAKRESLIEISQHKDIRNAIEHSIVHSVFGKWSANGIVLKQTPVFSLAWNLCKMIIPHYSSLVEKGASQ